MIHKMIQWHVKQRDCEDAQSNQTNGALSPMKNPCAIGCLVVTGSFLLPVVSGLRAADEKSAKPPEARRIQPDLITDRSLERTGFQEAGPYHPEYDLRTDFVMAYGVGRNLAGRLSKWVEAGYVPHVMTGVAWGNYQDYLDGKVDGREHWDEAQVNGEGRRILHGPRVPYMVPAVSFSDYLEDGVRRAIDAGAIAVHLEEPEFWADGGYSEAFRREWRIYYDEPWSRPDSSCDAQYRASKLKSYLYQRALSRLCSSMKEYALVRHGRPVRFYVPTHSLLNYTQWRIVSPEAALIDLPGIDGYIAQVWTGTARTPNTYRGIFKERTFETAFLEYGVMQELVRGTGRRMWFLADPVEDNPRFDWDDYRRNYLCTLVASLLHPAVHHYEVTPWPSRVFRGRFPRGKPDARRIPPDYATILATVFNQLRDMDQADLSWPETTEGVGVFLSDSAMFQRAAPAFREGVASKAEDATRATSREVRNLAAFYGLALPPLKHGIPIRPVQLDNVARFPGYLDDYRVLILSYEFQKPLQPGVHIALANWVRSGGSLIFVGADTDSFHAVREWWNRPPGKYASPTEHLFETLGLTRRPAEGEHRSGQGSLFLKRKHPAYFTRSAEAARELMEIVRGAVKRAGRKCVERNHLLLRRGSYVIAACLDESPGAEPLLKGRFVDLFDAQLSIQETVTIPPGRQAFLLDLDRTRGKPPLALASGGRIENWKPSNQRLDYTTKSMAGVTISTRIVLPAPPTTVTVGGQRCEEVVWHAPSRTVLIRHPGSPDPTGVAIRW